MVLRPRLTQDKRTPADAERPFQHLAHTAAQRLPDILGVQLKSPAEAGESKGKSFHYIITQMMTKGKTDMSELLKPVEDEGFVIDTDAKAEWALQKIREARKDRDTWVEWYTKKIEEIKAQTDFDTMNLERLLAEYFATVPHKKTKTQESYTMPGGKLILKTQNPEYKRDDKTVIEWLKANGRDTFVKVEEKLDWAGLKSATAVIDGQIVTEDGEFVPGVEVVDREAKFIVEV